MDSQNNSQHKQDEATHLHTLNLQEIQITYHKNMEFFKVTNQKLFNKLAQAPKEYNLHIDSYGFNIIHLPTQKIQYPFIIKQEFLTHNIQEITPQTHVSSMQETHAELAKSPLKNPKWTIFTNFYPHIESNFIDETKLPITGKYCNAMLKESVLQSTKQQRDSIDSINPNDKESNLALETNKILFNNLLESFEDSKFLPQTILYGLMGGLFLQDLLTQGYFFHSLIIYEENIDLFRISLYFLDYDMLFQHVEKNSCLIFIHEVSLPLISAFLQNKKITNNFLNLELKHYNTEKIQNLRDFIMKEKKAIMRGWGSFEDEKIGFYNALENLADCKILDSKARRINAPICVVGNGPSLDLCLDFLRTYQERMIILSCGTALKVLRHHNITPDFQVEIERIPYLSDVLQEANLGDIPLLYAQTTDTKAVSLARESFAFMRGGSNSAYLDSNLLVLEFSAPFVGNAGVALAAFLGSDCILCGIDCGFIQGYSKHAKNSFYGNERDEIPADCFNVESNKNLNVYSNDLYYLSAKNIEEAINLYKPNHAINIGYGAKFAHTLSLYEDEFDLKRIDKKQEIANFKANFTSYHLHFHHTTITHNLEDFKAQLDRILETQVQNLKDIFCIVDSITSLLQQYIAQPKMRSSIILLEGSCLHLSFSLLLSCLFIGDLLTSNFQSYDIIRKHFKHAIYDMIQSIVEK